MTRSLTRSSLLAFGLLATSTSAAHIRPRQTPANSQQPSSTGTQAPTTTQDVPQALISIAESLLSENYPSTTLDDFATISWPTTVVIGSHTYTIQPTTITRSHKTQHTSTKTNKIAAASQTGAKSGDKSPDQPSDKLLGIIIGVVLGVIAVAIMGIIFFCLHRRKKDSGSFFLRRSTPSMRSNGSWMPNSNRPDTFGTSSYVTAGHTAYEPGPYYPKEPSTTIIPRGNTPPISAHPAYHNESSRSTSGENPFYTPDEQMNPYSHELDGQAIGHTDHAPRSSSNSLRDDRPPTPFSPLMMMQTGPASRPQIHQNPFASAEDDEANDVVSPILPSISRPERRYSPMVHYPSWDEVSAFSFDGDERDSGRYEDGGDGWRRERERESRVGRHEMM